MTSPTSSGTGLLVRAAREVVRLVHRTRLRVVTYVSRAAALPLSEGTVELQLSREGIDRADVRAVIHLAPPGSIEAYHRA
jgi:hypothetical protein